MCERNGWNVRRVYEDSGLSAYRKRRRPGFEDLVRDAVRGCVIVAWRVDRLGRTSRDWGRLLVLVDDHGVRIIGIADGVDTATSGGRLTLGILAEIARNEASTLSMRIVRKHQELAERGRSSGGGTRAFGFTLDWSGVDELEAGLIREAVARVLAGETTGGILADWNRRGVQTPTGGAWQRTPFTRMLRSARIAGAREHAGRLVATGAIPAIIDTDTLRRVRAVLDDPKRRTTFVRVRVNLLPGFVYCGRCDAPLVGRPREDGVRRYLCPNDVGRPGCNGLAILAAPVEELVAEQILRLLDTPRLGALLADDEDAEETRRAAATLERAEEALAELSRDYYADRAITREEFFATRAELQGRAEVAREVLSREARRSVLVGIHSGARARAAWERGDLEWRRAVIRALISRITILPAVRGRNTFDASRVIIEWRA